MQSEIQTQTNLRETSLYREAEALHRALRRPGAGQISDASELSVSPDGKHVVYAGAVVEALQGAAPTRICLTELSDGDTRIVTGGPNCDRMPKFSPDGRHIAFLSDRHRAGDFQLYLFDPLTSIVRTTTRVDGWVEYLHWSPDGSRVLLGVAGHGADISGGQGAITSQKSDEKPCSWMPTIETGDEGHRWRRAWVFGLSSGQVSLVSPPDVNVWEAVWCGNSAIAAVASPGPAEGLWYTARLHVIELEGGKIREVYEPRRQLGWPAASPLGDRLAIVESLCSDRWIVAGDLKIIDTTSCEVLTVDAQGVDITSVEWRSDRHLLLAGHRGLSTVVGLYDVLSKTFTETWKSTTISAGLRYIVASGLGAEADCVLVGEGFLRSPEIAVVQGGRYTSIRSFELDPGVAQAIDGVEELTWAAPDGLPIQGWFLRPKGKGPYPLVMQIHGGPVGLWHPAWLGRGFCHLVMLLRRGFAVFLPNPRGSAGRGQSFIEAVLGDMGGADTQDYLSGIDYLIGRGLVDPLRLGVTGVSYGGFMSAWLITQDTRFAAAVPVAPSSNHVTAHLISNIPEFVSLFLADTYTNPGGKYFQRSPIMHVDKTKTPTLNICGALDRCTPPEEAVQFHNALLENGVRSVLVTYPEEGHGVRKWPASIDYAARLTDWFERHIGVT